MPRESIDTYTDGGVENPTNKWLATAGFGIWTPGYGNDEPEDDEAQGYTNQAREQGGTEAVGEDAWSTMLLHPC